MKGEEDMVRGHIAYRRMPIEIESPGHFGYDNIKYNLSESSTRDLSFSDLDLDLKDLPFCYINHLGKPALRELIVRGVQGIDRDDVLVTAGASAALFIINTSLVARGEHVIVAHPNYATNVETPRSIGGRVEFLTQEFEKQWKVDLDSLEEMVCSGTRLVSLTSPHNPSGTAISQDDLERVIDIVEKSECYLLFDETYRDMAFVPVPPIAATLSQRVISVFSLSKCYGLPGIRIGWLITKDKEIMETFLAAKEQIFITGSAIDEEIAYACLKRRQEILSSNMVTSKRNFHITKDWIEEHEYLEWVEPSCGLVCFPRFKSDIAIDLDQFYALLRNTYKTFVAPGHWFEMDQRYLRIGFAWPTAEELEKGLQCIDAAIEKTLN